MGYVEWLRVRRSFSIYAIVLFVGAAFLVLSVYFGIHNGRHNGSSYTISSGQRGNMLPLAEQSFQIPVGLLFEFASFATLVFASILATSLNKENGRNGFAFTKPVSRETVALTYFVIDVAAVLAAFVYALVLMFASLAVFDIVPKVYAESGAGIVALAGLGVSVMWYGLLQLATSARTAGGGLFVGLSWPLFLLFGGLYEVQAFGPIFHAMVVAVDFFNPLAYFSVKNDADLVTVQSLLGFTEGTSIAVTWALAVLSCTGAVFAWRRADA